MIVEQVSRNEYKKIVFERVVLRGVMQNHLKVWKHHEC